MYTLELAGDGETAISCPSLSPAQPELPKNPASSPKQTETTSRAPYPSTPSHNSASTHAPEPKPKNPAPSAVPQVPDFPQNPEVSNEQPNKGPMDFYQPQLPFFPFYPDFYYPYPEIADPKPTPAVQPTSPLIKKNEHSQTVPPAKLPLTPEEQVPQPFYPLPTQPEKELPQQPPATQQLDNKEEQPFYPYRYPFYVKPPNPDVPPAPRPEPKPLPSTAPVVRTTKDQRWKPSYPLPIYPQPIKPETLPTEPPVTKPPPSKVEEPFPAIPLNHPFQPSQKIVEPSANPSEGREQKPLHLPPFYPWYQWPPQPPASEVPQVQPPYPLYPENPEKPLPDQPELPKPPVFKEPQGQMYQPFHLFPYFPQGPYVPMPPTRQTPTPAPKGQVQTLSTLQPEVSKPKAPEKSPSKPGPESKEPPRPEAPQGQVYNPFYPNPFNPQPEPENQPAIKPTAVPKPPQPPRFEPPQGQMYQPFNPFYPQPEPENPPAEKTTAAPVVTEMPNKHVNKPSYPQLFKPPGAGTNGTGSTKKPVQTEQPSALKPPDGLVPHHFNPYYYYMRPPQHPKPVTVPPTTNIQQPQQVTAPASGQTSPESAISQPSNGGIVKVPELGSSPVYCPQFCPPGFSNCCPQIAFHQHLHHIIQAGPESKYAPPVYPGLPYLPSVAYPGFANGFGSTPPPPQKPTEPATTSSSAPISPQSLPSGNEKQPYLQPPDGNPAALPESNPSKLTNSYPVYPFALNSLYHWPYPPQNVDLQNLPQRQSPTHYSVPSNTPPPGNEPANPVVQYEPYSIQPPKQQNDLSAGDMNNPSSPQQPAAKPNKPTAKELQPSNTQSGESQTYPEVHSELNHFLVPYYMLQDAQAPMHKKSALPNRPAQPVVSGSKKSAGHDQTVTAYSEPKSYVLLQHGPPGREVNSFSALPSRHLGHDPNLAQNLARHHGSRHQHPQNLRPLQEKPQHPKWLGKGMSSPLPGNVNYMQRPDDTSESLPLPFSASDGPHFVPLPQDPSFSVTHLKPEFFDPFKSLWKHMTHQGSSQKIPAHVLGNAFQQWRSAADQVNGMVFYNFKLLNPVF